MPTHANARNAALPSSREGGPGDGRVPPQSRAWLAYSTADAFAASVTYAVILYQYPGFLALRWRLATGIAVAVVSRRDAGDGQ